MAFVIDRYTPSAKLMNSGVWVPVNDRFGKPTGGEFLIKPGRNNQKFKDALAQAEEFIAKNNLEEKAAVDRRKVAHVGTVLVGWRGITQSEDGGPDLPFSDETAASLICSVDEAWLAILVGASDPTSFSVKAEQDLEGNLPSSSGGKKKTKVT